MNGTGRRPRVHPLIAGFVAGILIAGIVGLMAAINLQYGAPWAKTHTMYAQITDADGMGAGSDVRIAGRVVGQVTSVRPHGTYSTITFSVYDSEWPLAADTSANVRLATLLGQKYLQLNPGTRSSRLGDGAVIGVGSTRPVVDFDRILDTFDRPTRTALTSLLRTVSAGVAGQEGTLQRLIPSLSDLSVHSQIPLRELVTRNSELNSILINLGSAVDQLNASRDDFAAVIDNLNSVTGTFATDEGSHLAAFIRDTDSLNQTTDAVLRSGAATSLNAGLQRLPTFLGELNQLLATLRPETYSFTQPVANAEPSDRVNGNDAIPARSAIDLIYEISNAVSQGYGLTNFGTASNPNVQGNFWLRQFGAGNDPCLFETPSCTWGQTSGGSAASLRGGASVAAPSPSSTPSAAPSASAIPGVTPSPLESPSTTPETSPAPSDGPSPSDVPSPGDSPSPTAGAVAPATPAPTPGSALDASTAGQSTWGALGTPAWDAASILDLFALQTPWVRSR